MQKSLRRFFLIRAIFLGLLTVVGSVFWYAKIAAETEWNFSNGMNYYNKEEYVETAQWFRKAAEQGHAQAQYHLGRLYDSGKGVIEDNQQAVNWYRKAAEQGLAQAQYHLGRMYDSGKGVIEDNQQAVNWYRKAAEQGNANAQYHLSRMYATGEGVTKDNQEASNWLSKAAELGQTDAQSLLAHVKPSQVAAEPRTTRIVKPSRLDAEEAEPPQAESEESNDTGIVAEDDQGSNTPTSCPDNQYALIVNATPATSRIRIMNIQPKYRPGLCLTPRRYDIYVTHRGYHSYRKWTTLKEADVSVNVALKQIAKPKTSSSRPSFNCAKATTRTERTICRNSQLSNADVRLARIYSRLRSSLPKSEAKWLGRQQHAWLKMRDACSDNVSCLLETYNARITELENIFAKPKTSLSTPLVFGVPSKYPQTSTRRLRRADIRGKSKRALRLMRNEIYARHGYIFSDPNLKRYFGNQPWYSGNTTDATKVYYRRLSQIERDNVKLIRRNE